ncbi:MAG: hypothetical protein H0U53_01845 [Actinobacteria bacterium]|nr:hypothetical protein [Actinomycetota bacterium]
MSEHVERPVVDHAIVVCATCGTPGRVKFEDGVIVAVYAVCGHMKMPAKAEG